MAYVAPFCSFTSRLIFHAVQELKVKSSTKTHSQSTAVNSAVQQGSKYVTPHTFVFLHDTECESF